MHVLKALLGKLKGLRGNVRDIFSENFAEVNPGFDYLLYEEWSEEFGSTTEECRVEGDVNAAERNCSETESEFD